MPPSFARDNTRNCLLRDAIILGDAFSGFSLSNSLSNDRNVSLRKLGPSVFATFIPATSARSEQPVFASVLHVSFGSHPFKVFESVVVLDAIDVVGHMSFGTGTHESFENEAMSEEIFPYPVPVKIQPEIAM